MNAEELVSPTGRRMSHEELNKLKQALDADPALRAARRTRRETILHVAADSHLDKVKVAVRLGFSLGRKALDKGRLKLAIEARDMQAADKAVASVPQAVEGALKSTLPKTLAKVFISGGDAGLEILQHSLRAAAKKPKPERPIIKMRFDSADPIVMDWARKHGAKLAKDLADTTRHEIAAALVRAFDEGDLGRLYDDVLDAVGDEARAGLIARTEVMIAANAGQRAAWEQAIEAGLLSGDEKRTWIATSDDRICPECEMLDGATTGLDGEYPDPGGEGPPLHPSCRCTEGIVG